MLQKGIQSTRYVRVIDVLHFRKALDEDFGSGFDAQLAVLSRSPIGQRTPSLLCDLRLSFLYRGYDRERDFVTPVEQGRRFVEHQGLPFCGG
jgi:hypothetical protein